jgi:hypothetical protein
MNAKTILLSAAQEEVMEDWPAYASQGNSCSKGCALSTAARLLQVRPGSIPPLCGPRLNLISAINRISGIMLASQLDFGDDAFTSFDFSDDAGRYHRCFGICARISEGIIVVFAYIRHCQFFLYLERPCLDCIVEVGLVVIVGVDLYRGSESSHIWTVSGQPTLVDSMLVLRVCSYLMGTPTALWT